jgi:hypothetical protein
LSRFRAVRASSGDDAELFVSRGPANNEQSSESIEAESYEALFARMRVVSRESAGIFEYGNSIRKIDAVPLEIGAGLVGIPLERH